jgi:hypothetical protein
MFFGSGRISGLPRFGKKNDAPALAAKSSLNHNRAKSHGILKIPRRYAVRRKSAPFGKFKWLGPPNRGIREPVAAGKNGTAKCPEFDARGR